MNRRDALRALAGLPMIAALPAPLPLGGMIRRPELTGDRCIGTELVIPLSRCEIRAWDLGLVKSEVSSHDFAASLARTIAINGGPVP